MLRAFCKALYALAVLAVATAAARAQQPIGTVSTTEATVSGVLQTSGGTATILNNGVVTAHDHATPIKLARGGSVNVCSTSVVHLSQNAAKAGGPLLVALDRGALELILQANSGDALMTPDMRIQPSTPGPLDLRIRVVSNGDTCVENRGASAPALMISDTFGESSYIIHAKQHVLFEHGSLKQVVDNESSPCGCPPPPVLSVAESGVSGANTARPGETVAKTAAEAHPFPEAVSMGLAPAPPPPQAAPGQTHAELGLTLNFDGKQPAAQHPAEGSASGTATGSGSAAGALISADQSVTQMAQPAAPAPAQQHVVAQAPPPRPPDDLAHVVKRFYRWLFRRKS
ncbi:MAG: nuclease [Acidobacteriaceae bacterium]|nr:nuclease [Acidobacteriaceae bacterium]